MNTHLRIAVCVAAVSLVATLAGCAAGSGAQHDDHAGSVPQQSENKSSATCDMHKKMSSAKTADERNAMMREHMKDMSPEVRQKMMQNMQDKCK